MKDRLMVEGVTPNAGYFEIGQDEWSRIREHVMTRFRPIVEFAFGGLDAVRAQSRLRQLVEKLWDAQDIDALAPVIKAMEPIGRASCRERVCKYVWISVGAVSLKKKKK